MILRLFGYQFPLFLGLENSKFQTQSRSDSFWKPISKLLFIMAAFGYFYEQFTPEEQKQIITDKPFFSIF